MKHILLSALLLIISYTSSIASPSDLLINELNPNDKWPLKWKRKIGATTYRNTLHYFDGHIIVGSNGRSTKEFSDQMDGVYILNAKTGLVDKHIKIKGRHDNDVTGIALSHSRLYFGSDNNHVYAYDWNYHKVWSKDLGSDIESAPSLEDINADGILDVIIGTEDGRMMVLNGQDGQAFWSIQVPFQPSWTYPEERSFMASPVVLDVNRDGIRDIIIGSRNGSFYAFDGKTGDILWTFKTETPSGILSSATYNGGKFTVTDSYGYLYQVAKSGRVSQKKSILGQGSPQFFSSPLQVPGTKKVAIGSHGAIHIIEASKKPIRMRTGKISASPLLANVMGDAAEELLFLAENGWLYCLDANGTLVGRFSLPYGGEATPLIADIDGDGTLELVMCTNDKYIACYDLQTAGPVSWGQFRGNPYNTGVANDTLILDFSKQLENNTNKPVIAKNDGYTFEYIQPLKYGGIKSDYKIEENRIGPAKLGMTFGRLKAILGRQVVYKDVDLGIGMKATAIMWSNHIHFYILYPAWKPLLQNTDVISVIATDSPRYKTQEGVHPGSSITQGSQLYGPAILTYHQQTSYEELITFKFKPKSIWFARYGANKAGVYKKEKNFNKTSQFKPDKAIQFIGIR